MKLFDDLDPDSTIVWGRDRLVEQGVPYWHIVGPTLPRIAPVSPMTVSPCGAILPADSMDIARARRSGPVCPSCAEFLRQRADAKAHGEWSAPR